ncbi:hypothetical protein OV203_41215 [Nannocystis sp. ILAH1]|uniref:hypothetical protein n=1 Tax=Nannocystis sp. ILAH1 TaxID=2996789 RepID=UPI00226DDD28|nr:hypothetical protein [Nannocystis sp. ILAH1]MCY0989720.1 hypothetical protein [Nannocystis sp. ILAH1]MCY0993631.1 hypothetical protein [Nannocystis sp. ILAH1]
MRPAVLVLLSISLVAAPSAAKRPPKAKPVVSRKEAAPPAPAIPASSWRALKDAWIEVSLRDGGVVQGRLAGSDDRTATIVEKSGHVRALAIADALELRQVAAPPAPPPPAPLTLEAKDAARVAALEKQYGAGYTKPKGKKMHTAGSVILSLGLTQAVLGVGFGIVTALSQDDVFRATSIGLLISGGITIAVGIPLMVKGRERRLDYHEWLQQQSLGGQARVVPGITPLRGGGGVNLRISF